MFDSLLATVVASMLSRIRFWPWRIGAAHRRYQKYDRGEWVMIPFAIDGREQGIPRRAFEIRVMIGDKAAFGWWKPQLLGEFKNFLVTMNMEQEDARGMIEGTCYTTDGRPVRVRVQKIDLEILRRAFTVR